MSDNLLTVRLPSGQTEFRSSAGPPEEGDVLRRFGETWLVRAVDVAADGKFVVTLEPLPDAELWPTVSRAREEQSRAAELRVELQDAEARRVGG